MKTLLTETMEQQNSNLKVIVAMEDVDEMEMSHKSSFLPEICAPVSAEAMVSVLKTKSVCRR